MEPKEDKKPNGQPSEEKKANGQPAEDKASSANSAEKQQVDGQATEDKQADGNAVRQPPYIPCIFLPLNQSYPRYYFITCQHTFRKLLLNCQVILAQSSLDVWYELHFTPSWKPFLNFRSVHSCSLLTGPVWTDLSAKTGCLSPGHMDPISKLTTGEPCADVMAGMQCGSEMASSLQAFLWTKQNHLPSPTPSHALFWGFSWPPGAGLGRTHGTHGKGAGELHQQQSLCWLPLAEQCTPVGCIRQSVTQSRPIEINVPE